MCSNREHTSSKQQAVASCKANLSRDSSSSALYQRTRKLQWTTRLHRLPSAAFGCCRSLATSGNGSTLPAVLPTILVHQQNHDFAGTFRRDKPLAIIASSHSAACFFLPSVCVHACISSTAFLFPADPMLPAAAAVKHVRCLVLAGRHGGGCSRTVCSGRARPKRRGSRVRARDAWPQRRSGRRRSCCCLRRILG